MQRDFKGVWIPKQLWMNKELTWTEKFLFLEIDSLAQYGECFASNDHFAEFLNVKTRQIQNILTSLKNKGLIKIQLIYRGNSTVVEKRIITPIHNFNSPETDAKNYAQTDALECAQTDASECAQTDAIECMYSNTIFNNTKVNNTSNKKIYKKEPNSAQFENEFETLWKLYPRKMGKANALKSYIKARKTNKVSYETIENGLYRYIDYLKQQGTEDRFILHGSTWFTSEKWLDEYISVAPQKKIKNYMDFYQSEFGGERNGFERNCEVIDHDSDAIPESSQNYRGIEF